jgi:phosphate transport system substrate-binding protein
MADKTRYYRCPIDKAANCPFAADRKPRPESDGAPFVCGAEKASMLRGCRDDLEEVHMSQRRPMLIALLVAVVMVGAWLYFSQEPAPKQLPKQAEVALPPPPPGPIIIPPKGEPPPAQPSPKTTILLKLVAATPLGEELLLPVVTGFLQHQKIEGISTVAGVDEHTILVRGHAAGEADFVAIQISSVAGDVEMQNLADGTADAVISLRRARPREVTGLRDTLGDLSSHACEEVIALDGLAVVIHKSNPLEQLTTQQVRSLLRAEMTDWSALSIPAGNVHLHLPRENTASVEAVKECLEVSIPRLKQDLRYDLPRQLSDAVAADPQALGLVPFRHVRSTKALATGDEIVVERLLPTAFTIATESYRLRQRVYLHHANAPKNENLLKFLSWVISVPGQNVVGSTGFVDLNLSAEPRPLPAPLKAALPAEIADSIKSTEVVDATIFFEFESFDPDSRARGDLNRVAPFLAGTGQRGKRLMLFGHADSKGSNDYNFELSKKRAEAVRSMLEQRGVHPAAAVGVGKQMPFTTNDTEEGRARNRRVELWIVELQ